MHKNSLSNGTNFVFDSVKIRKLFTILLKLAAKWLPRCIFTTKSKQKSCNKNFFYVLFLNYGKKGLLQVTRLMPKTSLEFFKNK